MNSPQEAALAIAALAFIAIRILLALKRKTGRKA